MPETLYTTRLYPLHQQLGAQWTTFANWQVPLQYQRVNVEHAAVRQIAGLFDISHMGIFYFTEYQLAQLDELLPVDVTALPDGKAKYSLVLTEQGTVVDDIMVYRLPQHKAFSPDLPPGGALLVANASNTSAVRQWFVQHMTHPPQQLAWDLLALQGPRFTEAVDAVELPARFQLALLPLIQGQAPVWAARTGYTGEDGLEIFCPNATDLWQTLTTRLKAMGGCVCGFAARDTLRLEAALPLYGHELSPDITPVEAGLGWAIKKTGTFIGAEALVQHHPGKQLVHLMLDKPPIPRQGCTVWVNGQQVGHVTSGCLSPTLGKPIAMALVNAACGQQNTYTLDIRGQLVTAQSVARPFYKRLKV
jgi:aminomethyltransferase